MFILTFIRSYHLCLLVRKLTRESEARRIWCHRLLLQDVLLETPQSGAGIDIERPSFGSTPRLFKLAIPERGGRWSFSEANEMVTLPRTTCWCPSYDGETSDDTLDLEDVMRHCFVLLGDQVCLKGLEPLLYFLLGVFLVFSVCECILRQSFACWSIPWWSIPLEPLANLLIKVVRSCREYIIKC